MTALIASEFLKLRTTRAPFGLGLAVLAVSGLAVAGAVGADALDAVRPEIGVADAAEVSAILATVLGILVVTNEYRHGTITPTFLVAPARERVVAAKVVVGTIAGLALGLGAAAVAFAVAVPWLAARGEPLGALDVTLAALRLVGAYAVGALLGVAVGTVVHSQIGAIVIVFAWFLVIEPLVWGLGELVDVDVNRYVPGSALDALVSTDGDLLAVPWALLLAFVYLGAVIALGTLRTVRWDAD